MSDIIISTGSYPSVASHSGSWSLNASTHSLDWEIPLISVAAETQSGAIEFSVGGDDAGTFFPVRVSFAAQGSLAGISISSVSRVESGADATFSQEASLVTEEYVVV